MTGIEILAIQEVAVEHIFNWTGFWTTIAIFVAITALIGLICRSDLEIFSELLLFGLLLGVLLGVAVGEFLHIPTVYATEYKVLISDEVSVVDFYDTYEVISQEGKIFTVRER